MDSLRIDGYMGAASVFGAHSAWGHEMHLQGGGVGADGIQGLPSMPHIQAWHAWSMREFPIY